MVLTNPLRRSRSNGPSPEWRVAHLFNLLTGGAGCPRFRDFRNLGFNSPILFEIGGRAGPGLSTKQNERKNHIEFMVVVSDRWMEEKNWLTVFESSRSSAYQLMTNAKKIHRLEENMPPAIERAWKPGKSALPLLA